MSDSFENPAGNRLPSGMTFDAITTAVQRSGYPLQTRLAAELQNRRWHVQEEWSYVDSDDGTMRALDLAAEARLYESLDQRVYPGLTLLVECKQSELPYVFFESRISDERIAFPSVAGLRSEMIEITDDGMLPGNYEPNVLELLGMEGHPFLETPSRCVTFSKCVRKGKDLVLSGTEPYQGLVLPLLKAAAFHARQSSPVETARYFHPRLTVPAAVISAPLVLAEAGAERPELALAPWIRLYRHESEREPESTSHNERESLHALDVIHTDFVASYLDDYLLPFAQQFAERAMRHGDVLALGMGHVPGYEHADFAAIDERLVPPTDPKWIDD